MRHCYTLLQEPKVSLSELRQVVVLEVRNYLRNHLVVLDGDGEVLLLKGLPVHPAKLVDLTEQVSDFFHPKDGVLWCSAGEYLVQFDLDGEEVVPAALGAIAGIVIMQELVVTQLDISAAEWHQPRVCRVESDVVAGLSLVDSDDV